MKSEAFVSVMSFSLKKKKKRHMKEFPCGAVG